MKLKKNKVKYTDRDTADYHDAIRTKVYDERPVTPRAYNILSDRISGKQRASNQYCIRFNVDSSPYDYSTLVDIWESVRGNGIGLFICESGIYIQIQHEDQLGPGTYLAIW